MIRAATLREAHELTMNSLHPSKYVTAAVVKRISDGVQKPGNAACGLIRTGTASIRRSS